MIQWGSSRKVPVGRFSFLCAPVLFLEFIYIVTEMIVYENGHNDRNEILALKNMRIFCVFAVEGNVGKGGGQKIDVL